MPGKSHDIVLGARRPNGVMRKTATTLCPPQCRFCNVFRRKRCKIDTVGDIKFVAKSPTRASCCCQRRCRKQEQMVNSLWGGHVSTKPVPEVTKSCALRMNRRGNQKMLYFRRRTRGVHGVYTACTPRVRPRVRPVYTPIYWFLWCFMTTLQ